MFGQESKAKYFSVTYTCNIGLARCVPQVCYEMSSDISATVEEMAGKGLARIYEEEMRFISGSPVPIKKPAAKTEAVSSAPSVKPPIGPAAAGKGGKKRGGREFE